MYMFYSSDISRSVLKDYEIDDVLYEQIKLIYKLHSKDHTNARVDIMVGIVESQDELESIKDEIDKIEFSSKNYKIYSTKRQDTFYLIPLEFKNIYN